MQRKKLSWLFQGFLITPIQNIWFSKEFLAYTGCFWLFTNIKKGFGTSFWCTFSIYFFHKNVPYLILYQLVMFQYPTHFPFQDIKRLINFKIYLQSSSQAKADSREKRGKSKYKNLNILRMKKHFRLNKFIFHNFLQAII